MGHGCLLSELKIFTKKLKREKLRADASIGTEKLARYRSSAESSAIFGQN